MQKPNHIVCCALPAWEAAYLRSTVELMKCLSVDNLVLYVDYNYTFTDLVKGITGKKPFDWKRLLGLKSRLRKVSGDGQTGMYVLSLPPTLPAFAANTYKLFNVLCKINAVITGFYINRAIRKLGMTDVIEFNAYQPFLGNRWKLINVHFKVSYIYDEFTGVPYFKGFAEREEKQYANAADLVVVTSDVLKKRKQTKDTPIAVVNNGVHFDAFDGHKFNRSMQGASTKIVGYTGNIDDRLDVGLLQEVIKQMPATAFVFIGKVFDNAIKAKLSKNRNVVFTPPVSAAEIPDLLTSMNVGIIPYVCNDLTAAIYPLKANEYLAMGLPVVMTPFASIGEADKAVHFANSPESFVSALEFALEADTLQAREARMELAKEADWAVRAGQLINYVLQYKTSKRLKSNNYQTELI
ncbi:glycosyltransferase [Mucilaginibacter psychrotolerans]|uniref:Glycosyltransferase n=1 Tax=Mucilaginibacter psychrotolerans TaxID=1524096 RepID=A0A4Y8S8B8_9SPHI|nr:glycosyltransferase [Mucilaginibacter psychrotolerans]TFF34727.1 glycosyltransferase [Mucilaginibacter psychrotolerans]